VQQVAYVTGKIFDCARCVAIGANAKRVFALDLKQGRVPAEKAGDLGIVDGHARAPSERSVANA
jgi:hypothetical protein